MSGRLCFLSLEKRATTWGPSMRLSIPRTGADTVSPARGLSAPRRVPHLPPVRRLWPYNTARRHPHHESASAAGQRWAPAASPATPDRPDRRRWRPARRRAPTPPALRRSRLRDRRRRAAPRPSGPAGRRPARSEGPAAPAGGRQQGRCRAGLADSTGGAAPEAVGRTERPGGMEVRIPTVRRRRSPRPDRS